ncbi:MAG: nuclear transport factor 2 family protein [Candidatus Didemnitutus sp.]|nr:nuclear transport factor 2 family protein [Candidatus Didemnitutus sp.]
MLRSTPLLSLLTAGAFLAAVPAASASVDEDAAAVAALDTAFQLAVKNNDAETIVRTLADDMVLITGRGRVYTREDHIVAARTKERVYEKQDEEPGSQKVRVWGDTAVVTALLWCKGATHGQSFDFKVWFSDTYVRTPSGWKYVFGQASLPLPTEPKQNN